MSSRSVSRRTVLTGAGAATLAAAVGGLSWGVLAHDGEEHGPATPATTPDATPEGGPPAAGTDQRHMKDGDSGVGGLYLTVTNSGPEPDALLGGTTAVCAAVEPHAMRMDGDMMAMVFLPEGLLLPPGTTVTLEPSGDHVMLVGLTQDLRPDTTFPIALRFQRAGPVDLTSAVRWVLDPEDLAGIATPVIIGDLTIATVWSRPAPMISSAVAEPVHMDTPATPSAARIVGSSGRGG